MAYYEDDDEVSPLEGYLRKVGSPVGADQSFDALAASPPDTSDSWRNYVQPADQQPNYVQPDSNPPPQQAEPAGLGMEMATNPPDAAPKRLPFSSVPSNAYDIPAPKVSTSPGTGDQQTLKDIGQNTLDHANIPTPPPFTGAAPGGSGGNLYEDQAKYGTPLDPRDPKYRMGIGQRILGTVGNALSSFGASHRGQTPMLTYVGPGATNRRYDQDETVRRANLENTNTRIKSAMELAEENRKQYNTAIQSQERAAIGRSREAIAGAAQQNAQTKEDQGEEGLRIKAEHEKNLKGWHDQLAELRKDPKNYTQLAVATRTETDPDKRAQLEAALQDVVKLEMKRHPGKAGGKPGTPSWVNGLTKEENAEARVTTELIGKQMITERARMTSASMDVTPSMRADAQANYGALAERANRVVSDIVARRTTQPPPAPAARTTQTPPAQQKSITKAQIQALADQNKIPYAAAEAQFKGKNYKIAP